MRIFICAFALAAGAGLAGADRDRLVFIDITDTAIPAGVTQTRSMDAEPIDIDGDGDLDLLVASEFARNILLINDGDGVFSDASAARLTNSTLDTEDIAPADYNGDGRLDVVLISEDSPADEFLLGTPAGPFIDASAALPAGARANAAIVAFLDGDALPDVLVGVNGQNAAWLNDGAGGFTDATTTYLPAITDPTQDLELGDVNGDTLPDLVVGNEGQNRLLIAMPGGGFEDQTAARLPDVAPRITREADFGDIDGDGDLDLFMANVSAPGVGRADRVLINDGAGFFTDESASRLAGIAPYDSFDADLVDLDGDGSLDVVCARGFLVGGARVLLNDGLGCFQEATAEMIPSNLTTVCVDVEVADFTGDGVPDLYVCNFQGRDRLYEGRVQCTPDLDSSGDLNFLDVILFLSAFGDGSVFADLSCDAAHDFTDVLLYLQAFADGCG